MSPYLRDWGVTESSVQRGPIKMRSLREIYEQIVKDGETNLLCLYVDHEPLTFPEAEKKFVGDR